MPSPTEISALYEAAQLTKLEPLAGFALALNLAYLNLQRWRYKQQVKKIAQNALDELKEGGKSSLNHEYLNQFNTLKYLADHNHKWRKLPASIKAFDVIFGRESDIKLSVIFAVIAFFILSVGVAHQIEIGEAFLGIATSRNTKIAFFLLMISVILPGFFVLGGRKFVEHISGFTNECAEEIASIYVEKVDTAVQQINDIAVN